MKKWFHGISSALRRYRWKIVSGVQKWMREQVARIKRMRERVARIVNWSADLLALRRYRWKIVSGIQKKWVCEQAARIERMREWVARIVNWSADPLLFAGFLLFSWLAFDTYSGLDMDKLQENGKSLALEWMKFYAYLVGGIILIWQVRISNRRATALEKTVSLTEKGNITERFKNAIEHLGNSSESIRMGGVYALYHVAKEASEYADTVQKILCAHAKAVMSAPGYTERKEPSNEIAAILDVLFPVISANTAQNINTPFQNLDISGWHLRGSFLNNRFMMSIRGHNINLSGALMFRADLSAVDLLESNFYGAFMRHADFSFASLSEVVMAQANLENASFVEARASGLQLPWANLLRADLSCADLTWANFYSAKMRWAKLTGAELQHADFSDADLSSADLSDADLSDANLSRANLSKADLSEAHLNNTQVTVEQLLKAKTLYEAVLDDNIREEILRRKPELLGPPAEEKKFFPVSTPQR